MEPDFRSIIIRVMLIGGVIVAIGTTGVVLALRAYGAEEQRRAVILTCAALAFLAAACIGLLIFSLK